MPRPVSSSTELRAARLARAVDTLLEACRRGDVVPELLELLALHSLCLETGAYEAAGDLRQHLRDVLTPTEFAQLREREGVQ